MYLLQSQPLKLQCFRKAVLVRSSPHLSNNGFSSPLQQQTPPCYIAAVESCGPIYKNEGKLVIKNANEPDCTTLDKKVSMDVLYDDAIVKIGSSHGWIATLKNDGILRLQDDLNPVASDTNPKRIPLPPLVTLPHCQTQIVTNVSMSSSSPDDEDCVVAVKFLGPQLSFCRPAQRNSEWVNVRIENPCFYSSRVMYSKKDDVFRIPGSGGHLIGSWDLRTHTHKPKLQSLRFRSFPRLKKTTMNFPDSCCKSEHLVESPDGETFLVKWYKKSSGEIINGIARMETKFLLVFKLDEQGNAVYTQDIGDLVIFLSKSEPFCVPASSFPGLDSNSITFFDTDEVGVVFLHDSTIISRLNPEFDFSNNYLIPPQKID